MVTPHQLAEALAQSLEEARLYRGATSPNPPVGAAALDADGRILSVQAHQRAGTAHAEARVIEDCRRQGCLSKVETLVVTLEPCNHQGRTPPCTQAILAVPSIRRVFMGIRDPNSRVAGGGATALAAAGLTVEWAETSLAEDCASLIAPFSRWAKTGLPWVVVKTAHQENGSMIPPAGQKTFSSPESLVLAHRLRRESDAILTGSGTVLADRPEFTVRHVADHAGKKRWLVIMDRRGRVPAEYLIQVEKQGLRPVLGQNLEQSLRFMGREGVLSVLVEAGPTLSQNVLETGFWQEHVVITHHPSGTDRVEIRRNLARV